MFERCNRVPCDSLVGIELVALKFDDGLMTRSKKNFSDLIFITLTVVPLLFLVTKKDKRKAPEYLVLAAHAGPARYKIHYLPGQVVRLLEQFSQRLFHRGELALYRLPLRFLCF